MQKKQFKLTFETVEKFVWVALLIAGSTGILYLIGRQTLGEGVIALLYLFPISWVTSRWGHGLGIFSAVIAALSFDFFFIPPFFTFTVGSLEGWLILIIFLLVAVGIVGRIQAGFAQAQEREREAMFMYEMSLALAGSKSPEEVARNLANKLEELYLATLVQVTLKQENPPQTLMASSFNGKAVDRRPDRIVPIMTGRGLVGEICIWSEKVPLPPVESRLLQNFAAQAARALEYSHLNHAGVNSNLPANNLPADR
jgi:two-component system sensor histidine kinase KdpD